MEETDGDVLTLVEGEYDEVVLDDGAFLTRARARRRRRPREERRRSLSN